MRLMRKCVPLPQTTQSEEREEGNSWRFPAALPGKKHLAAVCSDSQINILFRSSPGKKKSFDLRYASNMENGDEIMIK